MNIEKKPIDSKDNIINIDSGEKRRYNVIKNDDGTISLEDVTDYRQISSSFGAQNVNGINKAINDLNDRVSDININVFCDSLSSSKVIWYTKGSVNTQDPLSFRFGETVFVDSPSSGWRITLEPKTAYQFWIDCREETWYNQTTYGKVSILYATYSPYGFGGLFANALIYGFQGSSGYLRLIIYNFSEQSIEKFQVNSYIGVTVLQR